MLEGDGRSLKFGSLVFETYMISYKIECWKVTILVLSLEKGSLKNWRNTPHSLNIIFPLNLGQK